MSVSPSSAARPLASHPPKFSFDALRVSAGYLAGLRQRALICPVALPDPAPYLAAAQRFRTDVAPYLPEVPPCMALPDASTLPAADAFLLELGGLVGLLQIGAGVPVMDRPRVLPDPQVRDHYSLLLPTYAFKAAGETLAKVMALLHRHANGQDTDWAAALDAIYDALEADAPQGDNAHVMMMAAAERSIPAVRRPGGTYHFGWGCNGQVFRGGVSERTAMLAATAASDKRCTHMVMRTAGLPVAEQHLVPDLKTALAHADRMGYPVVLKANRMELGAGVISHLPDAAALSTAWEDLISHGRDMLIEKHVPGRLYRINVVDNRNALVIERRAAEVTGDGIHSVTELIEIANRNPLRSKVRFSFLRPLELNDTARILLDRQSLRPDDVPEAGRVVALGLKTNRKDGGFSQVIPDTDVHPDNITLGERAAQLLRLDIAGVDLLIPDIGVSWRQGGAYICEINSAPGMAGSSLPVIGTLLDRIPERGRIPVDIVLGDDIGPLLRERFADQPGVAVIENGRLDIVGDGRFDLPNAYAATYAALIDARVTRLVIVTDAAAIASNGLMVDRADRIWMLGTTEDDSVRSTLMPSAAALRTERTLDDLIAQL